MGKGYGDMSTAALIGAGIDPFTSSSPGFGGTGLFGNESMQGGGGQGGLGTIADYLNQNGGSNDAGGYAVDVGSGVYNTTGVTGGAGIPTAGGITNVGMLVPGTGMTPQQFQAFQQAVGPKPKVPSLGRVYGNDTPTTTDIPLWMQQPGTRQVIPTDITKTVKLPNPDPIQRPKASRWQRGQRPINNISDVLGSSRVSDKVAENSDKPKKKKTNVDLLQLLKGGNQLRDLLQLLQGTGSSPSGTSNKNKGNKSSGGIPNPVKVPAGGNNQVKPTNQNFPRAPVGNNQLFDPNSLKAYYAANTPGSGFTSPFAGMGILNPQTNMQTTIDQPTGGMPSYLTPSPTFNLTYASGPQQLQGNQPPQLSGGAMQQGYGVSNPQGIQNMPNTAMNAAQAPQVSPQVLSLLKSLGLG